MYLSIKMCYTVNEDIKGFKVVYFNTEMFVSRIHQKFWKAPEHKYFLPFEKLMVPRRKEWVG